jgi:hypothetical protein
MWATVGRHGEAPEPSQTALELYQNVWPERYLKWDAKRGMYQIRQVNPDTGTDERVELVFEYAITDEAVLKQMDLLDEQTQERVKAAMIESRSPVLSKVYRPFDMQFVKRRLKERSEFLSMGARRYSEALYKRNATIRDNRLRSALSELGYFFKHEKRHFPVLAGEGEGARRPLVQGEDFHVPNGAKAVADPSDSVVRDNP